MHFSRMLSAFQSDPQCSGSVKCIHYLSPLIHVNLNDNLNGDRQPIRIHIPLPETAGYLYLMMLGRDGFQLKLADSNNQKQQSVVTINCQIADLYRLAWCRIYTIRLRLLSNICMWSFYDVYFAKQCRLRQIIFNALLILIAVGKYEDSSLTINISLLTCMYIHLE